MEKCNLFVLYNSNGLLQFKFKWFIEGFLGHEKRKTISLTGSGHVDLTPSVCVCVL